MNVKKFFHKFVYPVVVIDEENKFVWFNSIFQDIFHYKKEDLIDKKIQNESLLFKKEEVLKVIKVFNRLISKKKELNFNTKLKTKYSKKVHTRIIPNVLKWEDKYYMWLILVILDQEFKNEFLTSKNLPLKRSPSSEKRDSRPKLYLKLLIHDLTNVLNNIKSCVKLMELNGYNLELKQEFGGIINEQLKRGFRILLNVRKLSQIDKEAKNVRLINTLPILKEIIDIIERSHFSKKIEIKLTAPYDQILVRANELLFDVFENILYNSIIYNNKEIVRIHINIWGYLSEEKKFMLFEFIDNGIGIDNIKKKFLFEEKENEKNAQGLGFGLIVVKKILTSYNGFIWVEDRIDGKPFLGTKFSILIPTY